MADEIILKAPTVEQQVNITISGEEKLRDVADTLNRMSMGRKLQDFWKNEQQLLDDLERALKAYLDRKTEQNAESLLKVVNAYKAVSNPDFGLLAQRYEEIIQDAKKQIRYPESLDSYSIMCFKKAFSTFEMLQAYGTDMDRLFEHFK